ncbi:putative hydro-lyase [Jannaschia aquimarina]|uniref:Putative hydro-lyase jaqu_02670 n=1 Tax=Jannaschia aquimarina TaxID=935700 RepID=A0A0D1EK77_9RHOB|nr:putative hydro-lyase [Jannaschia aquimarina]KIT17979.1 hypothetical protein jaqu_02670 [Jannaschia aquimarina]SNT04535.1 Uncharacterized protein YcsI, UPF0317 family [Jannaschia aquimarina]
MRYEDLIGRDLKDVRAAIRNGAYRGHTAGLAPGRLQANLVILPEAHALDFLRFCLRNPKPCPIVGVGDTGDPRMPTLGDIDLRTDLPSYRIHRDGVPAGDAPDICDLWSDDLVGVALGCSFTFEHALIAAGIDLWHVTHDRTVPMFRSTRPTVPAGPFAGPMVVSLRMIPEDRAREAAAISARYPQAHGAPVHTGDPAALGIADAGAPDWGDPVPLPAGHVPMFWACGVTPQAALAGAKLPFAITHTPGHMLICDMAEDADAPPVAPGRIPDQQGVMP